MKTTLAAVAAGLLIVAAAPAFAGGNCGSYTQSVERSGDHRSVSQSDQATPTTTQTASTETASE